MKITFIVLLSLLTVLSYKLFLAKDGLTNIAQLQKALKQQEAKNQKLVKRNIALESEVNDLKHGKHTLEELARQNLGMIKKQETYYQFVDPKNSNNRH